MTEFQYELMITELRSTVNRLDTESEGRMAEIRRLREVIRNMEREFNDQATDQAEQRRLAIHNTMILIMNWHHELIDQAFPVEQFGSLNVHFRSKFEGFCNSYGGYASPNAILHFYFALSDRYKQRLCEEMYQSMEFKLNYQY